MSRSLLVLVSLVACAPTPLPVPGVAGPPDGLLVGDAPAEAELPLQDGPALLAGAYVLRVADDAALDDPAVVDALAGLGASELVATAAAGTFRFDTDAGVDSVAGLGLLPGVAWVEPVVMFYPQSADPAYPYAWHHPALHVAEAWAHNRGAGAVVAVIDTGVIRTADLGIPTADGIEHLLPAKEYLPVQPVPLPNGAQFVIQYDDVGHGTHVASTIAQRADNGVGSAGIAPEASILPIRALGQAGGDSASLADAIRYATDNGADVINMSWGSSLYAAVIEEACQYAADHGVVLIAAAGNDGNSHFLGYPAAFDTVISVGAIGPDEVLADYSNRGPGLDVVAPGGVPYDFDRNGMVDGVLAETWMYWLGVPGTPDGAYLTDYFLIGTSMATATVSGVAALLVAEGATRDQVYEALTSTAVDLGDAGYDADYGFGLVDAAAAVDAVAAPPPPPPVRAAAELVAGDLVITEFMANPSWCADDGCEWFEVQNASATAVDLAGLVVVDAAANLGTVDASVVVQPGGLAVIGRGTASGWSHPDVHPAAFYGTALALNNSGDTLAVRNATATVAGTVTYDATGAVSGVSRSLVGDGWVGTNTLIAAALTSSGEWATPNAR
ncbi:MAG: S8 family serine peptidase [Myxococcota bacterium]